MQPHLITGAEALTLRHKLGLNQSDFWHPVATTQSCGSRYESCRDIPGPVQLLVCIKYGAAKQRREALKIMKMEAL